MNPERLVVRQAGGKGRGVFANVRISAGERVAVAATIELREPDTDAIAATVLDDYYFAHPADPDGGLLVLGLPTLCNHSDSPNVDTRTVHAGECGWMVELHAVREIMPGDEITRRYACEPWFDPAS